MGEESQRVESLPDPAREAPDPVLAAFVDGFVGEEPEFDERLQERVREVLGQRPLAPDALGAALALVEWLCREVLPLVSLELADLPALPDFAALEPLSSALAGHEQEAKQAWLNADRHDDDKHATWTVYDVIRDTRRAVLALRRIPRYRTPDPDWKAKQARPTPMSLCHEAAGIIATAFESVVDVLPDAERALDRLGLDGAQDRRARVERARRALDRLGIDGGVRLLDLAERVVVACDAASPGRPEEIADRALSGFAHEPVATVVGSAALRGRPLDSPSRTVSEAASSVLRAACVELTELLLADPIERAKARRTPSAPTPVERTAPRPTADDHVRRVIVSLERGRRDARGALRASHQLGAELTDGQRREVAAAVLDRLMSERLEARRRGMPSHGDATFGQLLAADRFRIGAVDGPMLVPLVERSFVHLWRSEPAETIEQAQTLCGGRIVAAGAWRRLFDLPSDRDDEYLFGYGSNRRPCAACLKAAREDGQFPPATEEPEWPAHLRERAIDAVLAMDVDAEEWHWTAPLDALLRAEARRLALADAERLSVLCAQRTLGPARFLKEQAAMSGPLGALLTAEDWGRVLAARDVSVARTLIELADERQADLPRGAGRGGAPSWDEHFAALVAFHAEQGHTRVPRSYEVDGIKLGGWLRNQRQAAKGAGRKITAERRARLDQLDPNWTSGANPPRPQGRPAQATAPSGRPSLRLVRSPDPRDGGGAA